MSTPVFASTNLLFDVSWTHAPSTLALYGFCVVYLCLVLAIVGQRTVLTITGEGKANEFSPTGEGGSAFTHRLVRAHAKKESRTQYILKKKVNRTRTFTFRLFTLTIKARPPMESICVQDCYTPPRAYVW